MLDSRLRCRRHVARPLLPRGLRPLATGNLCRTLLVVALLLTLAASVTSQRPEAVVPNASWADRIRKTVPRRRPWGRDAGSKGKCQGDHLRSSAGDSGASGRRPRGSM